MAARYQHRFRVRSYELNAVGELNPATYLNYMEDAAVNASASLGYDYDWYTSHQRLWVARRLLAQYHASARVNDELQLTTWISQTRRVQAYREYELRRVSDNALLMQARHLWVYINSITLAPERLPPEFADTYQPTEQVGAIDLKLDLPVQIAQPRRFMSEICTRYDELDANQHVNNAVYVQWVEQAITGTLHGWGWPPEKWQPAMQRLGRETDYFRSTRDNEPLRITTGIQSADETHVVWLTEIVHADSGHQIAQDRLLCRVSDTLRQALVGAY